MPIKSRWATPIPKIDITTYIFKSPTHPLPNEPILIDSEKPDTHWLSLHDYRALVQRIAFGLRAAGLKNGDRVLLYSGNNVYFPAIFMGIVAAGGVFTGANPNFTSRELAYQLHTSGSRFCITNESVIGVAVEAADLVGMKRSNMFLFDDGFILGRDGLEDQWISDGEDLKRRFGVHHWSVIVGSEREGRTLLWKKLTTDEELNTTAAINFSSGTTGLPKGVEITHKNLVAHCVSHAHLRDLNPSPTPPRWIGMLPMYHAYGQTFYITLAPSRSIPVYILAKFDFQLFLSVIERFRITSLAVVPPIMIALAKHPDVLKYDLSSVTRLSSGAAPMSRDIAREVERRLHSRKSITVGPEGSLNAKQGWGMTETTCSCIGFLPHDKDYLGSVGELMPNCEGKIMDAETGTRELPRNQEGELWVRSPVITKGYYRNPTATAETINSDGWLKTGDIAYVDNNGKWFIVDRKKELIKVKGNQVAPAELESVLLEHPKIADAAVIGILYAGEERPRAYVVPRPGLVVTKDEVLEWIEKKCARHKWITGGVVWEDTIPKNPSGKILRKVLRERAKMEIMDKEDINAKL